MSATISIRTDSELKKDFEVFCKSVGMNSSTALTIFMKKVVAEKRIPFEIGTDPFYSKENMPEIPRKLSIARKMIDWWLSNN